MALIGQMYEEVLTNLHCYVVIKLYLSLITVSDLSMLSICKLRFKIMKTHAIGKRLVLTFALDFGHHFVLLKQRYWHLVIV